MMRDRKPRHRNEAYRSEKEVLPVTVRARRFLTPASVATVIGLIGLVATLTACGPGSGGSTGGY
jgi:hypothetical protein